MKDIIVPIGKDLRIRVQEQSIAKATIKFESYEKGEWILCGDVGFEGMASVALWLPRIVNALNRLEKLMLLK